MEIRKTIGRVTVAFLDVDPSLADRVNKMLDLKIERKVPLEKIQEEMLKFGWKSEKIMEKSSGNVFKDIGVSPAVYDPKHYPEGAKLADEHIKTHRGRQADPKKELALKLYAKKEADGLDDKQLLALAQKELGVSYANAYNWLKAYRK